MDYSFFEAGFWTGETGRKLHGDTCAQVLAAYLFTSKHKNQIGVYYLPLVYVYDDTGLTPEQVRQALAKLSSRSVRFCAYDDANRYVWVYSMARRQTTRSPKALAGAAKVLAKLPAIPFRAAFEALHGPDLARVHSNAGYPIDTLSIPYPDSNGGYGIDTVSGAPDTYTADVPDTDTGADAGTRQRQAPAAPALSVVRDAPSQPETPTAQPWTAERAQVVFRAEFVKRWHTEPSMAGKNIAGFHATVQSTAELRQADPEALYREVLAQWFSAPKWLNEKESEVWRRCPYACFVQTWGALTMSNLPSPAAQPGQLVVGGKVIKNREAYELAQRLMRENGGLG